MRTIQPVDRARNPSKRSVDEADQLKEEILASLPAHIAVVDCHGVIIAVNEAWTNFGRANGLRSDADVGVGASYIHVCERAARLGDPVAAEALVWIQAIWRGDTFERRIDYQCDGPDHPRWLS